MHESSSSSLPLNALHLPDAPAWFPLAWGWWASAGALIVLLLLLLWQRRRKKKRVRPQQTALRLLATPQSPSSAMELLRQAALCYFPREEIAQLTGAEWYAFLDSALDAPLFTPQQAQWQQALYSKTPLEHPEQLVAQCVRWVTEALPPRRRSSNRRPAKQRRG